MYRTHNCGQLRLTNQGQQVHLCGWIQTLRLLGNLTFIDVRDHYGLTQLIVSQAVLAELGESLGREYVIQAIGTVIPRKSKNPTMPTGDIEVEVSQLTILNAAQTPPFKIADQTDGGEELRMKYRYLDLRRNQLQQNLKLRQYVAMLMRKYLYEAGFNEIETPFLIKSTPEGARDFVIPSRMNPQQYYALPQSPQTFKQLLMIAGYDRYYQLVRCFRDEDLRADRQPEFTQLDCEMSFVHQEDIFSLFEGLITHILKELKGVSIDKPIKRITYEEALRDYGTDKPDLRFDMKIKNLKVKNKPAINAIAETEFPVFAEAASVLGLVVEGGASYTRKEIDQMTDWVKRPQIGMKGLVYIKYGEDKITSSIGKFFTDVAIKSMVDHCNMKTGDILFLLAGPEMLTRKAVGELRLEIARKHNYLDDQEFSLLWVTDFPLFLRNEDNQELDASHHPFTAPALEDLPKLDNPSEYADIKAQAYDMVINGVEIGGGSIRIHKRDIQEKIFQILKLTPDEIEAKFGFILDAFNYGAPPHGGIAFGFDRICALLAGTNSIRDVIAFPKNNNGRDIMLDAPATIDKSQLDELHLTFKPTQ